MHVKPTSMGECERQAKGLSGLESRRTCRDSDEGEASEIQGSEGAALEFEQRVLGQSKDKADLCRLQRYSRNAELREMRRLEGE